MTFDDGGGGLAELVESRVGAAVGFISFRWWENLSKLLPNYMAFRFTVGFGGLRKDVAFL